MKKRKINALAAVMLIAASLFIMGCDIFQIGTGVDTNLTEEKSICGPTSDLQNVNQYDGSLGISIDFVNNHKAAVGALATKTSNQKYCSGTLIGRNLFITAGHCIGSTTIGNFVSFNYELSSTGQPLEEDRYEIVNIIESQYAGAGLDFAILELKGNPGDKYGWRTMKAEFPDINDTLIIIQHPAGRPKEVEVGRYIGKSGYGDRIKYSGLDTEGGSSGSGILDADGYLIGVHTNGGCSVDPASGNQGFSIKTLSEASETVRKIMSGTPIPTSTPVPTQGPHGPVWLDYITYKTGDRVVYNGYIWEAKWETKGDEPGSDQWGPWKQLGPTGDATPVPTATSTNTPIPTATTPPNQTPTPVVTNTPGPTATPVPATPTATSGSGYPAWALNATYTAGDIVSYNGSNYKALVTHTAYADSWNPVDAPTLWKGL